jgi:hypothetical protein
MSRARRIIEEALALPKDELVRLVAALQEDIEASAEAALWYRSYERIARCHVIKKLSKDTPREVKTDGEALISRPLKRGKKDRVRESAKRTMAAHDKTLRKLAK